MRRLLVQTHMRGGVGGKHRDLREVLNGLICGNAPFLADAVKIAQISGQP